jgi:hypothetical protein
LVCTLNCSGNGGFAALFPVKHDDVTMPISKEIKPMQLPRMDFIGVESSRLESRLSCKIVR